MNNYYDIIYKVTNSLTNKVYIDQKTAGYHFKYMEDIDE